MSKMIEKLNRVVEELRDELGEGLVAADIWHTRDAQPLTGIHSQPKAVALFNEVTRVLRKTLKEAEFPGLGNYYMLQLDNGRLAFFVLVGDYQLGFGIDLSKATMGVLMSVALPKLLKSLEEATS